MLGLSGETLSRHWKTESCNSQAGSRGQGPLVRRILRRFSSFEISSTVFASSRRIIMALFAVSINGFSIFVHVVGWIQVCQRVTRNFLKIVLRRARCQRLLVLRKHLPDISLFLRIVPIYLFKTLLVLMLSILPQMLVMCKTSL